MSMIDDIRKYLAEYTGPHTVPDVAKELGLTNKQASATLGKLVKNGEAVKSDDGFRAVRAEDDEIGTPEPAEDEDLIGDVKPDAEAPAEEPEELFYEFIDFPGNYSIAMAPFALEIAAAAGVAAKSENIKGSLTRRVSLGGPDMDRAKAVKDFIVAQAEEAHAELRAWQKKHAERRRSLTDMQKYLEHREQLTKFGSKVARKVKKDGLPS